MESTVKYENRTYYDTYGTGNYTEDKSKRYSFDIPVEKAKKFSEMWIAMGYTHYETNKAHFYEVATDSTHCRQYILYK